MILASPGIGRAQQPAGSVRNQGPEYKSRLGPVSGFYFDCDDPAVGGLENGVYLNLVLGAVMVEACPLR